MNYLYNLNSVSFFDRACLLLFLFTCSGLQYFPNNTCLPLYYFSDIIFNMGIWLAGTPGTMNETFFSYTCNSNEMLSTPLKCLIQFYTKHVKVLRFLKIYSICFDSIPVFAFVFNGIQSCFHNFSKYLYFAAFLSKVFHVWFSKMSFHSSWFNAEVFY